MNVGRACSSRWALRGRQPSPATARPAAGRSSTARSCRRSTRSTTCTGPTGSTALGRARDGRDRRRLPQRGARRGCRPLAREMARPELTLEAAGGIGEQECSARRRTGPGRDRAGDVARRRAGPDGPRQRADQRRIRRRAARRASGPVRLSAAPLVEGAVAAAAAAAAPEPAREVAAEARGVGDEGGADRRGDRRPLPSRLGLTPPWTPS